jgi:hypothetical protein
MSVCSRLARRGGVKRMSATVYGDMRAVVKQRLELVSLLTFISGHARDIDILIDPTGRHHSPR